MIPMMPPRMRAPRSAGAAPLAALMQEREAMKGKRAGVILSGGNIDMPKFAEVLEGRTPEA